MPKAKNATFMGADSSYEVQRQNNWEVVINDLGDDLTFACESFPLPSESNEQLPLNYMNTKVNVAGQYNLETFEMVLKDFIGKDTEKLISDWRQTVFNSKNGSLGFAANYKKSGNVYEYSPDGSVTRVWNLEGVWPSSVNYGSGDYNAGDKKTISVTLSVDRAYRA